MTACNCPPDRACVWCGGKNRIAEMVNAEAVRHTNACMVKNMDNLLDVVKRIQAEDHPRNHINGLTFPENLWHRIGQMVEHFSVKDVPAYGNFFMGLAVQTSKILPENQIVIMQGRLPIGIITIGKDGKATVNMVDETTRKSMTADCIHDIFTAKPFK